MGYKLGEVMKGVVPGVMEDTGATTAQPNVEEQAGIDGQQEQGDKAERKSKPGTKPIRNDLYLNSLKTEEFTTTKQQAQPSAAVLELKNGMKYEGFVESITTHLAMVSGVESTVEEMPGILVWCSWSRQLWYVPTKEFLDENFIYRADLAFFGSISGIVPIEDMYAYYAKTAGIQNPGIVSSKKCYILDQPKKGMFEVYHDHAYPAIKYGKISPNGMHISRYWNRFDRDWVIMSLTNFYENKAKGDQADRPLNNTEAVIVSKGVVQKEGVASSCIYADNSKIITVSSAHIASDCANGAVIAEASAAIQALRLCTQYGRRSITMYYGSPNVVHAMRNKSLWRIDEVRELKSLLESMAALGYNVLFVNCNKRSDVGQSNIDALIERFMGICGEDCTKITELFGCEYKDVTVSDGQKGKTYGELKKPFYKKPSSEQKG